MQADVDVPQETDPNILPKAPGEVGSFSQTYLADSAQRSPINLSKNPKLGQK